MQEVKNNAGKIFTLAANYLELVRSIKHALLLDRGGRWRGSGSSIQQPALLFASNDDGLNVNLTVAVAAPVLSRVR